MEHTGPEPSVMGGELVPGEPIVIDSVLFGFEAVSAALLAAAIDAVGGEITTGNSTLAVVAGADEVSFCELFSEEAGAFGCDCGVFEAAGSSDEAIADGKRGLDWDSAPFGLEGESRAAISTGLESAVVDTGSVSSIEEAMFVE